MDNLETLTLTLEIHKKRDVRDRDGQSGMDNLETLTLTYTRKRR